ncbi:cryptochrome/photolyase family protein [Patulibacter defluvii]|uniref:cryptochrome/photolyase family protein n=1 Tax=Patulibacter defluvii TaxID=3095358 RepID=UPI002A75550D|nr:deoxyribodipyrimidine photo-lyase [Patulibacter sp. DM4]
MATPEIVWFRRDLRVRDHPALHTAASGGNPLLPLFVVDPAIVAGPAASRPRARFLADSLRALDAALRERGGRLVVRHGDPATVLPALAAEVGAAAVRWTADASPFGRARDRRVAEALRGQGVEAVAHPGQYVVDPTAISTGSGTPYVVFTPFGRAWAAAPRRALDPAPRNLRGVPRVGGEGLPSARDLAPDDRLPDVAEPFASGGEDQGLRAARAWLDGPLADYADRHDALAAPGRSTRPAGGTSGLSPHLRWGTISPAWLEQRARDRRGEGPAAFVRQLAWRDFFGHVYRHHPGDRHREHQPRYRALAWEDDAEALAAWRAGRTGYPLVDAGMRQLAATGWMHNRARMVVGSFLTKDLHADWRHGERHFHRLLLDGEPAQNDGNWQWIASVGVDPKPYFQRLFNPVRQQQRFDPDGVYVRRWVPELARVPDRLLAEPWRMSEDQQRDAGCAIGRDYPSPIVDHAAEREHAAARYRAAGER